MSNSYTASPREEELQMLRQLMRENLNSKHSATYDIAKRLEASGEAMMWWEQDGTFSVEITAKGKKALE